MPSSLAFLEDYPREQTTEWLRRALAGKIAIPGMAPGDPPNSAILAAESALAAHARRDLAHAVLALIVGLRTGPRPAPDYVGELLSLVVGLDLKDAVPALVATANSCAKGSTGLDHHSRTAVAYAILNLRVPQPRRFWLDLWHAHPRDFSPPAFAALLDHDRMAAIQFLPDLGNDRNLADSAVLSLDFQADQLTGAERDRFRAEVAAVAGRCKAHIRNGILEWLEESGAAVSMVARVTDSPLARALGGAEPPSSARLCSSLAAA
jgi:hypothetical protein